MKKLSSFLQKASDKIVNDTKHSFQNLFKDIQTSPQQTTQHSPRKISSSLVQQNGKFQEQTNSKINDPDNIPFDQPLQNLQLQQSKLVVLSNKAFSQLDIRNVKGSKLQYKQNMSGSRIKQIQQQKKRILDELKKLDGQIAEIKNQKEGISSLQKSQFHKKVKISDDTQAKKQAQSLIKQLHLQKAKMQQKKRKNQQKQLEIHKREEMERRKQKQQLQRKLKQQKRLLIERRLQQQKKKRAQRQLVDKHSNQLIQQLKKQQELERQRSLLPGQIMQYQQKKKLLQKKNIFNINQIQDHQKKYKQFKSKQKQLRRQKSESTKMYHPVQKYGKNMWVQRIQQEQTKRKQQQKMKQLNRRKQLQKRMKYGDLVKNIFMSKHKKREQSQQQIVSKQVSKQQSISEQPIIQDQPKPRTPDARSYLPKIPQSDKRRQNQTDNKFKQRQQSNSIIQNKRSRIVSKQQKEIKQKDPQQQEKLHKQKQRQAEIRKQTKQRLKKLQNQSIELPKPQKIKYENYMAKVKVKRQNPNEDWKKIMDNQSLSKQQKYKQMLNKANYMQNQAKIKQDLRKSGDQDAVNLYIGSIQAKLALLQRF